MIRNVLFTLMAVLFAVVMQAADNDKLPELRITVSKPIVKGMSYADGTMRLTDTDGSVVEMKAKFKTRGATAQKYMMKPSLNMKLRTDDYLESQDSMLLGMRSCSKWILDAMAIDRICMRNRICMDVWNAYSTLPYETDFDGRSGTVGKFVEMYINDSYYGIYCLSDHINRKLLQLKKYDEAKGLVRGVLYKSGTEDIADQNNRNFTDDYTACTVGYHNAWELKEPEDHECLEAWQPLLDLYDGSQSYSNLKKYFYVDNLIDYQLLIMAFSVADNWGNKNHYLSIRNIQKDIDDIDPTEADRRKFIVSPWDLDTALGGNYRGDYYNGTYSQWTVRDMIRNGGFTPFSTFNGQSDYKERLKNRWMELRLAQLSVQSISERLDNYTNLFINSGAWQRMTNTFDSRKSKPCYVNDLAKEVTFIKQWYAARVAEIDAYFGIEATGIECVPKADANTANGDAIYNLQGIRLNAVPSCGMYIMGGKLMLNDY